MCQEVNYEAVKRKIEEVTDMNVKTCEGKRVQLSEVEVYTAAVHIYIVSHILNKGRRVKWILQWGGGQVKTPRPQAYKVP